MILACHQHQTQSTGIPRNDIEENKREEKNVPQSNTQPPDTLRLQTNPLTGTNQSPVLQLSVQVGQVAAQFRGEGIRTGNVVGDLSDLITLEIREWLSDYNSHDNDSDEKEEVCDGGSQEGEDIVEEKNPSDYAVDYCYTGLFRITVSWKSCFKGFMMRLALGSYHCDCSDKDTGRSEVTVHDLCDEVGRQPDDSNKTASLDDPGDHESCTEGTVFRHGRWSFISARQDVMTVCISGSFNKRIREEPAEGALLCIYRYKERDSSKQRHNKKS